MDYKLAKQLKDAKFPGMNNCPSCDRIGTTCNGFQETLSCPCKCHTTPTLSELIDACEFPPDLFTHEITLKKFAYGDEGYRYEAYVCCQGMKVEQYKTPEESVAKLWLKLNK